MCISCHGGDVAADGSGVLALGPLVGHARMPSLRKAVP